MSVVSTFTEIGLQLLRDAVGLLRKTLAATSLQHTQS